MEPLAYELFNAAFVSVWVGLYFDGERDLALEDIPIVSAMESALRSPNLPPWILTVLLNLFEFMEMQGLSLPLDIQLLGREAQKSHAYAKCLHYNECCFKGIARLENGLRTASLREQQHQSSSSYKAIANGGGDDEQENVANGSNGSDGGGAT